MKRNKRRLKPDLILIGFLGLFIGIISFFIFFVYHSKLYSIQSVEVHADLSRINVEKLRLVLNPLVEKRNFFELNLKNIEAQLEKFPGVSAVSVRRVWPHKLIIEIFDQEIIAFWNDNFLMNRFGELYPSASVTLQNKSQIPRLYGPPHAGIEVFDYYQQFNHLLHPLGVSIDKLYLKPDQTWIIILDNGLEITLNKKQAFTRLSQFVKIYEKVFNTKDGRRAISVDLRYKHGMAVNWGNEKSKKSEKN